VCVSLFQVNVSNISNIIRELFQENLVRGKGLFARSVIQAQGASPMFSHVYAALVAIINTKLPRVGERRRVELVWGRQGEEENRACVGRTGCGGEWSLCGEDKVRRRVELVWGRQGEEESGAGVGKIFTLVL